MQRLGSSVGIVELEDAEVGKYYVEMWGLWRLL